MPTNADDSLGFYNYLCQKIGTPKLVRTRRLFLTANDLRNKSDISTVIVSGSSAEGLDLVGSDIDLMYLTHSIVICETEQEAMNTATVGKPVTFIMDTKQTKPCFTRLRLLINKDTPRIDTGVLEVMGQDVLLSSESFKLHMLFCMSHKDVKLHGPCVTTSDDALDIVSCMRCNKWISPAQEWIFRSRSSWPSPDLVFTIASFGVLFVPIGCKGSPYERLEWRISFSVPEKLLIYSFNQTQLLCYALMKILLKEVINKEERLNGLLCSYFIKTLIFWILEESKPSMWRPDNITQCCMACLKRLIYSVKYSTLLHYFITENNFFEDRFDSNNKTEMENLLIDLYKRGWRCFLLSETLNDYQTLCLPVYETAFGNINLIPGIMIKIAATYHSKYHLVVENSSVFLYVLEHKCRKKLEKDIVRYSLSKTHQNYAHMYNRYQGVDNKQLYYEYKQIIYHLLLSLQNTDAVSGWLQLASCFYVNKRYITALLLTKYALSKCSADKLYTAFNFRSYSGQTIDATMIKCIRLCRLLRVSTIDIVYFDRDSTIVPKELLKLNVMEDYYVIPPVVFGHFLSFLCYYHLNDIKSCRNSLKMLTLTIEKNYFVGGMLEASKAVFCQGIGCELVGDKYQAMVCSITSLLLDENKFLHVARQLLGIH